jgi:glucokinase
MMVASPSGSRLVGDIGATNARFALIDRAGRIERISTLACDDYPTLAAAIEAYLAEDPLTMPSEAALAVASPVIGEDVTFTNHPWSFHVASLQSHFAWHRLVIVNDFTANALAVPQLKPEERIAIGGGAPVAGMPIGVLGPGTGLGVSGLVPIAAGWAALASEGGHATLPAQDDRESEVLARMRRRFDHVSAERILSGPGLINLYNTLAEIEGVPAAPYTPAQLADRAIGQSDPVVRAALAMFCAMLGTVASDLALTLGARGGVYIAGGIVPRLGASFAASGFRRRFEAKGRFGSYLTAIPTYVVTHPHPAFLGLSTVLDRPG